MMAPDQTAMERAWEERARATVRFGLAGRLAEREFKAGFLAASKENPEPSEAESEYGACVRCGRQDWKGEFVELIGSVKTPDNPDGGTGDPICPRCIKSDEVAASLRRLADDIQANMGPTSMEFTSIETPRAWVGGLRALAATLTALSQESA